MARSVRANIIANYVGAGWGALMGLAFVPVYIAYLGIESYGLIGLFATLQAWLTLLDLGLAPSLNREMARLRGGAHTGESIRDLLRSIEAIYGVVAVAIPIGIYLSSSWLATNWINASALSTDTVAAALAMTGIMLGFRWIGGLYRGALAGLQEQLPLNISNIVFSTLRGAGVIAVLAVISNSIEAFFIFQAAIAGLEAAVLAWLVYRYLPPSTRFGKFSVAALRSVWRFAAGITVVTLLSLVLGQIDKIILPTFLPLSDFGYYILASAVAGALSVLIGPVATAIGPRFAELVALGEREELASAYHRYTQLLAMALIPTTLVVSFFSYPLLLLWTRDEVTSQSVAPLVSILVIGIGVSGLSIAPLMLQFAFGKTRFATVVMIVSIFFIVPGMFFAVPRWGAAGASTLATLMNLGYFIFAVPAMHRILLRGELSSWYFKDILPTAAGVLSILLPYNFITSNASYGSAQMAGTILGAAILAGSASLAANPLGREIVARLAARAAARWRLRNHME